MANTSEQTTPETGTTRQRIAVRLVKDLIVLAIMAVVAEALLQGVAPQYRNFLFDREFTGSQPLALNEEGCRGPAVPLDKAAGMRRMLALGDSFTFGTGVAVEDTWPSRVAEDWAERSGSPVDVMNAAMPAADVGQLRYAYEQHWRNYEPDVVVLAVTGNMVALAWIRLDEAPAMPVNGYAADTGEESAATRLKTRVNRVVHRFCLPSFVSTNAQRALFWLGLARHNLNPDAPFGALLAYGWRQADLDPNRAEAAWDLLETQVRDLRDAAARDGVPLVVTFAPARFTVSSSMRDNEKNVPRERLSIAAAERFERICDALDIPHVNALSTLRDAREETAEQGRFAPLYIPFDYTHLDPEGHAVVADAMLRAVDPGQTAAVQE